VDDPRGSKVAAGDLLARYLNRRLPWGTPWWPYAIALGIANGVRQLVQPDLSPAVEIAVFVAMVAVVVAVVTAAHLAVWPRSPVIRPDREPEVEREPLRDEPPKGPVDRSGPWAPWWWYLVAILGANYLRQLVMPVGTVSEWAVVLIVVAMSAVLFVVVTWVHRATQSGIGRRAP
jgi:hypothetical protein